MFLRSIKITNFRRFEELNIKFDQQLTVLVGKNGSGKSSILDATAIAAGSLPTSLDGITGFPIRKEDARISVYRLGDNDDVQPIFPVEITAIGCVDGHEISWKRVLNSISGRCNFSQALELTAISNQYQKRMREGDSTLILPLVAYYGTGRLWNQHKEKSSDVLSVNTRINGYIDSLDSAANDKLMKNWFSKMRQQELQRQEAIPVFRIVCQAMEQCLNRLSNVNDSKVDFNLDTREIDVQIPDENGGSTVMPLNKLSDGYKCTVSLIADIAYRMALLNPQLRDRALAETDGIVLIDEIDLHLHPEWQKSILDLLLTLFPRIQFIVSTHAPSVVNTVKSDNLMILENDIARQPVGEIYGKDTNTIVSGVMQSTNRPPRITELFDRFNIALQRSAFSEAHDCIAKLETILDENDAELAACQSKLKIAEVLGE